MRLRISNCGLRIEKQGVRRQETAGRDGDAAKSICERLSRRFSISPLLRACPPSASPSGEAGRSFRFASNLKRSTPPTSNSLLRALCSMPTTQRTTDHGQLTPWCLVVFLPAAALSFLKSAIRNPQSKIAVVCGLQLSLPED